MLTREDNEYLCRVGPDTPMGAMLRRFWVPVCLSADIPEPDGPPRPVRMYGEDYVAFRDTRGQAGVLDERCFHRGASLAYGRVEDRGIRCLYHGWKFGADGTIQETPNLADASYRQRMKAQAYPVREAGDLVWAYFGPPDSEPPFPHFSWMDIPSAQRRLTPLVYENVNWVQMLEGLLDSSHVGILHQDEMGAAKTGDYGNTQHGRDGFPTADDAPVLQVENTDFGFHYAAIRAADDRPGHRYVRITPYILPFMVYVPPGNTATMFVPVDDTTTAQYGFATEPVTDQVSRAESLRLLGLDQPGVLGPDRRFRMPEQDRAAMGRGDSFTGFRGLIPQDAAMTLSMGPILDRSREHVVAADMAVLRMRRQLITSARQVAAGGDPIGLDRPVAHEKIEGSAAVLPADTHWRTLVPGNVPVPSAAGG